MAALWLRSGTPPSLPLGHTFSVSLFAVVCDAHGRRWWVDTAGRNRAGEGATWSNQDSS